MEIYRRPGMTGGFTLLEVTAAIAILIVGIMALSGSMFAANRCRAMSRERLIVSRAVANQLEQIGEIPFKDIATRYTDLEFDIAGVVRSNAAHPAGKVQVTVKDFDLLEVTVTGNWIGSAGSESFALFQEFSQ